MAILRDGYEIRAGLKTGGGAQEMGERKRKVWKSALLKTAAASVVLLVLEIKQKKTIGCTRVKVVHCLLTTQVNS